MRRLLHGIRVFQQRVFPSIRPRFEQLASGQNPSTLFITCSDSRIVPELLTQTDPGELFVLRNAGNLVPPHTAEHTGEAATIEYAVQVLEVSEIVICGHSHCGAMAGLLRPDSLQDLPMVRRWLQYAERTRSDMAKQEFDNLSDEQRVVAAARANVLVQLDHLRTYPAVASREKRGKLTLHGWLYRFETGEVESYDPVTGKFVSVLNVLTREVSVA